MYNQLLYIFFSRIRECVWGGRMLKNGVTEQVGFIPDNELVNEVIILQEASEMLGCGDSTLRKLSQSWNIEN